MKLSTLNLLLFLLYFLLGSCNSTVKNTDDSPVNNGSANTEVNKDETNDILSSWNITSTFMLDAIGFMPQFSEDARSIIYTSRTMDSLWMYDLKSNKTKLIVDAKGAGYLPAVINNEIIYQVRGKRKYLEKINIKTGTISKVISTNQSVLPEVFVKNEGLKKDKNMLMVSTSEDLQEIIVHQNGEKNSLKPQGAKNYLNVSLSPDKTSILYDCPGYGGFVIDLEGKIKMKLGEINTPSWIDDDHILYAKGKDDGHQILSSEVFVYDLKLGKQINVSKDLDVVLEYPRASETKEQIIAQSPEGEMYLIQKK